MASFSESLLVQGKKARRVAWLFVALIVITVFFLVFFFFVYSFQRDYPLRDLMKTSYEIEKFMHILAKEKEVLAENKLSQLKVLGPLVDKKSQPKDADRESDDIKKKRLEIEMEKTRLATEEQKNSGLISAVSSAVARVGAVFIGLYLVQILLGFSRYHFKLADHLLISAETLDACEGDIDKFKALMMVISTNHIDFGKSPCTPVEKILDVVKDGLARQKSG